LDRGGLGDFWSALRLLGHMATGNHTRTTIVTFLMVFLIKNAQNRDNPSEPDELKRGAGESRPRSPKSQRRCKHKLRMIEGDG
jgi:hypothetical protein